MTTIKQHLDKVKKKAHKTQKKNGQYLRMNIARLSSFIQERNQRIKDMTLIIQDQQKEIRDLKHQLSLTLEPDIDDLED